MSGVLIKLGKAEMEMKKRKERSWKNKGFSLIFSIILVFSILGTFVFSVARKISAEMSSSAIYNLSESLGLIKGTIQAILTKEAEFQKLLAKEITMIEEPEKFIRSYEKNRTMVRVSLIFSGETEGVSNIGDTFSEKELDFSAGNMVEGLPVSQSYINSLGTWAYTIKCPVIKDNEEIAALYVEYIYDSFDEALPGSFYNGNAMLYVMDAKSERMVLKPKGMGERTAGHLNLQDFYRANNIMEPNLQAEVAARMKVGKDIMFYHDIRDKDSLIYMWAVKRYSRRAELSIRIF